MTGLVAEQRCVGEVWAGRTPAQGPHLRAQRARGANGPWGAAAVGWQRARTTRPTLGARAGRI
eukprot:4097842-Lingulodinium_polyedra.AAC.1